MRYNLLFVILLQISQYKVEGSILGTIFGSVLKKGLNDISTAIGKNRMLRGKNMLPNAVLPDCINEVNEISFVLFTRYFPYGTAVQFTDSTLPVDPTSRIVFLVHGFQSDANITNFFDLASTWLKRENVNIFSVEWKDDACQTGGLKMMKHLSYIDAVFNVRSIGVLLAQFTKRLINEFRLSMKNILLVGHSLGAHVCGIAGKEVEKLGLGKYPQIIGLDPAGPAFETAEPSECLHSSDAEFVQIFHTAVYGMDKPMGTVDFYFNGGDSQPGCLFASCSHGRAINYLTESIRNANVCKFLGRPYNRDTRNTIQQSQCTPYLCSPAGLEAIRYPARGTLYVTTSAQPPYCTD